MCVSCGCSDKQEKKATELSHEAMHQLGIAHKHEAHRLRVEQEILSANNQDAAKNRAYFVANGIYCLNLVSSPGSGKTTLLEATIGALKKQFPIYVIEGDQQGRRDSDRVEQCGAKSLQINTENGCHLDAAMVYEGVQQLSLEKHALLVVENVGNLVCPALFDLGESDRVVVISVTEGEDKPLKYPYMFEGSSICIINKIDLLPHLHFDMEQLRRNLKEIHPHIRIFELSATQGEGMDEWYRFLQKRMEEMPQ